MLGFFIVIMRKEIKIWYDKEGDYLEVIFERKPDTLGKRETMQ